MKKTKKTNAARILDELGIPYRLQTYPVDEEHLDAIHVAHEVGMLPEQTFKTLCVRGDKTGVLFAVIPGNGELDLKALARASGNKRCEMVHLKELLPLTGYIRGGCSPLGAKKEMHDMLGINQGFSPRFLRRYANLAEDITRAVQTYIEDVKTQDFPNEKEQY